MAIKISSLRSENKAYFEFPNFYIRLKSISNNSGILNVFLSGYADKIARNRDTEQTQPMPGQNTVVLYEKNVQILESNLPNPIYKTKNVFDMLKHCVYLYMKSLPEFSSGTDVLEDGQNTPV
jgi:hypothetical protein